MPGVRQFWLTTMEDDMLERLHEEDAIWLGKRLEAARKEAGLSRMDVVRELGLDRAADGVGWLEKIEAGGDVIPDVDRLRRLGRIVGGDLDALAGEINERERRRLEAGPPLVLGALVRDHRERAGLTVRELVANAELEPVEKYRERFESVESGEVRFLRDEELRRICEVVDLPLKRSREALRAEYAHYDRLEERPLFVERYMPAIYGRVGASSIMDEDGDNGPGGGRTSRALQNAESYAADKGRSVAVVFPDRRTVYIYPDGRRRESMKPPAMSRN